MEQWLGIKTVITRTIFEPHYTTFIYLFIFFWHFHCLFFVNAAHEQKNYTLFRQNEHVYHGTCFIKFIMIQYDEQADV